MKAASDQSDAAVHNLDPAADQAIATCGGDAREAVKALLVVNDFIKTHREVSQISTCATSSRACRR